MTPLGISRSATLPLLHLVGACSTFGRLMQIQSDPLVLCCCRWLFGSGHPFGFSGQARAAITFNAELDHFAVQGRAGRPGAFLAGNQAIQVLASSNN